MLQFSLENTVYSSHPPLNPIENREKIVCFTSSGRRTRLNFLNNSIIEVKIVVFSVHCNEADRFSGKIIEKDEYYQDLTLR